MGKYSVNNAAADVVSIGEFDIVLPKYQCDSCGRVISKNYFDKTGECASCRRGDNVTEGLERIYTVSIYLPDEDRTQNGVVEDISEFSDSIYKAKGGEYISEMANVLKYGFQEFDDLSSSELIVYPPSGEGGNNHMKKLRTVSDLK